MSTKTNLPTDYDAAEKLLLAAADGHYAACTTSPPPPSPCVTSSGPWPP